MHGREQFDYYIKFWLIVYLIIDIKFCLVVYSRENLWCYDCNTDLRLGHKGDCNDPYTPNAFDLIACPRNETHHCHKSIILCTYIRYYFTRCT